MPIYDNDGATNYKISKVYDNDGATNYKLGKVYDNDGTTNYLVYSAKTPIVENSTGSYQLTKAKESFIVNEAVVTATKNSLTVKAGSGNTSGAIYYFPLDIKGMKTLRVKANKTATQVDNLKRNMTIIMVGTLDQLKSANPVDSSFTTGSAKVLWQNDSSSGSIDTEYTIDSYTGSTCYVGLMCMGYYSSTTKLIIETLTVS